MTSFKVGDEVYIKGVVELVSGGFDYPVKVSLLGCKGVQWGFNNDGEYIHQRGQSLFHASETKREYKIGQNLNGFAEVMQALIDGQFIGRGGYVYRVLSNEVVFFAGDGSWKQTSKHFNCFENGIIVEDPMPKKMVAYKNEDGVINILPLGCGVKITAQRLNKQELAAILERVE